MKGPQTILEFEKGEATAGQLSAVLAEFPPESQVKVLSYMNGDVKKVTITQPYETQPAA